jgi:ribose transport system substrate-binding protein
MTDHENDHVEIVKNVFVPRRKFLAGLGGLGVMGVVAPGVLAACGSDEEDALATTAAPRVGLLTKAGEPIVGLVSTLAIEFYNEWNEGAKKAAEALGLEWQLQVDEFDTQAAISIMESETASGKRMFAISSLGAANEPEVAGLIQQSGGYVINNYNIPDFYTPWDTGPNHIAWLMPNEILATEQLATIVIEAAGGSGNFAHVTGHPTTPVDWRRTLGVDNALAKFPNAKLVARVNADWNRVLGQEVMANMIVETGGDIDGVFGQNDDSAIGALAALEEAGLDIPIFGMDAVAEARDLITEGRLTTSNIVFASWVGGNNVVSVFDAVNGFIRTPPERFMEWISPPLTVDGAAPAKKVSDYKDKINEFDWELMSRVLHPQDWDPQNELHPRDPDEIWSTRDRPTGWKNPLAGSIASGEFDRVDQLYQDHYNLKII